jgi:hypothetical protein
VVGTGKEVICRCEEPSVVWPCGAMEYAGSGFKILPAETDEFAVAVGLPAETGVWSTLLVFCNQVMLPGVCETTVWAFRLS